MITSKECRIIFVVLIILMSFTFWFSLSLIIADDHGRGHNDPQKHDIRKEHDDADDKREWNKDGEGDKEFDDDSQGETKDDEGDGVTGQMALWLLVAANLNIVLSLIVKSVNRFLPLAPETITSMKRFKQLQKKYLMRFHYVLNPLALCIAILHFLLSSCRKSFLPEWGLILMFLMVVLGFMLKFRASPMRMRRFIHSLHSSPAAFSAVILVLVVGHLMVD